MNRYGWRQREDGLWVVWDVPADPAAPIGPELVMMLSGAQAAIVDQVEARWGDLCRQEAGAYGVPDGVCQSHIYRESGGNARAYRQERHADGSPIISPGGRPLTGIGLMQITAPQLKGTWTDEQLFDPALNIRIGSRYLAFLGKQYNWNFPKVCAAFNAGSVRPSQDNPWNMVQTSGHVTSEVMAYNYWASRRLDEAQRIATTAVTVGLDATVRNDLEEMRDDARRDQIRREDGNDGPSGNVA